MSSSSLDTASNTGNARLPEIHLLCMLEEASDAFEAAVTKLFPTLREHTKVTVHNSSLKYLDKNISFDATVSPANSFARLDGAYDDALARAYAPKGDYGWITRVAQTTIYEQWRGFAPPGTCTIVPLVEESGAVVVGSSTHEAEAIRRKLPWDTKYLLLCPTMRIPQSVTWDREVVYECIWSLLCAIDNHNRACQRATSAGDKAVPEIKSILMTPLATGCGDVSNKRWAEQCVIAVRQWVEASENPEVWSRLNWEKIGRDHKDLLSTYKKAV